MLWHDETFLAPSKTNIGPTSKKSHHFFWSWCASTKISMPMTVGSWYSALGSPQVLGISCQDHLEKGPSLKTGALWQTWKLLMSCLYLFIVSLSLDTYAYVYICNKKKRTFINWILIYRPLPMGLRRPTFCCIATGVTWSRRSFQMKPRDYYYKRIKPKLLQHQQARQRYDEMSTIVFHLFDPQIHA